MHRVVRVRGGLLLLLLRLLQGARGMGHAALAVIRLVLMCMSIVRAAEDWRCFLCNWRSRPSSCSCSSATSSSS